jgi:hypothetical protein
LEYAQSAMKKVKDYFPVGPAVEMQRQIESLKGEDESAVKQAQAQFKAVTEGIEQDERRLTDLLGEQIGRYDRVAAQGNPVQTFQFAMRSGLPGRAVELFRADPAAFRDQQNQVLFNVLELQLSSGLLEQAAADFDSLDEDHRTQLRSFEFHKCVLEGNYTRAGVVWEQMNGRFPKLRAEDRALVAAVPRDNIPELAVIGAHGVTGLRLFADLIQQANAEVASLRTESQFYHVRGLLFLIEGQIAEAKKRFEVAPTPQGMTNLPLPWAELDQQYVRMIDAAAKK